MLWSTNRIGCSPTIAIALLPSGESFFFDSKSVSPCLFSKPVPRHTIFLCRPDCASNLSSCNPLLSCVSVHLLPRVLITVCLPSSVFFWWWFPPVFSKLKRPVHIMLTLAGKCHWWWTRRTSRCSTSTRTQKTRSQLCMRYSQKQTPECRHN